MNLRGGLTEYSKKYVFDFFGEPAILIIIVMKRTNIMLSKNYHTLMESKTLSINFLLLKEN